MSKFFYNASILSAGVTIALILRANPDELWSYFPLTGIATVGFLGAALCCTNNSSYKTVEEVEEI